MHIQNGPFPLAGIGPKIYIRVMIFNVSNFIQRIARAHPSIRKGSLCVMIFESGSGSAKWISPVRLLEELT